MLVALRVLRVLDALLVPALLAALAGVLEVRPLLQGVVQDYGPLSLLTAAGGAALAYWCLAGARAMIPCAAILGTAVTGAAAVGAALYAQFRPEKHLYFAYVGSPPSTTRDVLLLSASVAAGTVAGWWTVHRTTRS